MKNPLDCTIVLLSYNTYKITDTCLTKIDVAIKYSKQVLGNTIKVIVVDNGSKDGSSEMIRKKHPKTKLIALKENIGYSAGNNLAMEKANTPFILLMNSDTYIQKDSIAESLKQMQKQKRDYDILVSRVVYDNGEIQKYSGHLPTPLKAVLWSFGFESIPFLNRFLSRIYGHNDEVYTKEGTVEWYSPNFMLIKRKVYSLTHGFDTKLWFHMVDIEWCQRIHQKDLKIHFTPTIQVTHLGGASSKDIQDKLLIDNFKGLAYFMRKHYPQQANLVWFFVRFGLKLRSFFYLLTDNVKLSQTYNLVANQI